MVIAGAVPKFRLLDDWGDPSTAPVWSTDVAVGPDQRVYLFAREDPTVFVYEPNGEFVTRWDDGIFTGRPHGITITPQGSIYCVEDVGSRVREFSLDGKEISVIGPTGDRVEATDNWNWKKKQLLVPTATTLSALNELEPEGGPPYNRPTKVGVASNGDLYISDGYRNCKVHRFSPQGELIASWGRSGTGPGEFHLLHSIMVSPDDRVYVTDRENDRIQIFDLDGVYLCEWENVHRPHGLQMSPDGFFFVAEAKVKVGRYTFAHGVAETELPVRITVRDELGTILDEINGDDFAGDPHSLTFDAVGNLYVIGSRKLQKYARC